MATEYITVNTPAEIPGAIAGVVRDVMRQLFRMEFQEELIDLIPNLQTDHAIRFRAGIEDTGAAWAPNAKSTIRKKGHGVILIERGDLEASLTTTTPDSIQEVEVEIGQRDTVLTFGTRDGRSAVNQFGDPEHNIPARPHVGVMDNTLDEFTEKLADDIVSRLAQGSRG